MTIRDPWTDPGTVALTTIRDLHEHPLSNGQAIGRYLAYYVSSIPLGLGLLWVAFDRRKQGWHDKLAGTFVIRK